jgi:hypothetical protein
MYNFSVQAFGYTTYCDSIRAAREAVHSNGCDPCEKRRLETHAVNDEVEMLLAICSLILISNFNYLVDTNYQIGLLDSRRL